MIRPMDAFNIVVGYGFCGDCRWKFESNNCVECDCYQRVKFIKNTMEKQIPKKPIDVCEPCVKWGICPTCKGELNMLGNRPNRIFENEKYCKDCGQAIDWSD